MPQQHCLARPRLSQDGRVAKAPLARLIDFRERGMKVHVIGRAAGGLQHGDRRSPRVARRLPEEVVVHRREAQEIGRRDRARARSPAPVPRQLSGPGRDEGAINQACHDLAACKGAADVGRCSQGLLTIVAEDLQRRVVIPHDELAGGQIVASPLQIRDLRFGIVSRVFEPFDLAGQGFESIGLRHGAEGLRKDELVWLIQQTVQVAGFGVVAVLADLQHYVALRPVRPTHFRLLAVR